MQRSRPWRLAAAAVLPMLAILPAAGQGQAGYDYPGGYAGRFDGVEGKGGAGANEAVTIGRARRMSADRRAKARKTGGAGSLAPAAKSHQGYWDVPRFQGGTKVGTQGAKGGLGLQAK